MLENNKNILSHFFKSYLNKHSICRYMEKSTVYLFTSPTCPHCPPAKKFIHEFKKTRDDFVLKDLSTMTSEGARLAKKFEVMSVPTFIIAGPGYPYPIGLKGVQSKEVMDKYLDISQGKRAVEEESNGQFWQRLKNLIAKLNS
jgi:protein-disulfide isomerase